MVIVALVKAWCYYCCCCCLSGGLVLSVLRLKEGGGARERGD